VPLPPVLPEFARLNQTSRVQPCRPSAMPERCAERSDIWDIVPICPMHHHQSLDTSATHAYTGIDDPRDPSRAPVALLVAPYPSPLPEEEPTNRDSQQGRPGQHPSHMFPHVLRRSPRSGQLYSPLAPSHATKASKLACGPTRSPLPACPRESRYRVVHHACAALSSGSMSSCPFTKEGRPWELKFRRVPTTFDAHALPHSRANRPATTHYEMPVILQNDST
jgi:hypothetical protein